MTLRSPSRFAQHVPSASSTYTSTARSSAPHAEGPTHSTASKEQYITSIIKNCIKKSLAHETPFLPSRFLSIGHIGHMQCSPIMYSNGSTSDVRQRFLLMLFMFIDVMYCSFDAVVWVGHSACGTLERDVQAYVDDAEGSS